MNRKQIIEAELAALETLSCSYSENYCEDLAMSRVEARIKADREAADRARISKLKQPQLEAEHEQLVARYEQLWVKRTELTEDVKKARRALDFWKLQEERDRIISDIDACRGAWPSFPRRDRGT